MKLVKIKWQDANIQHGWQDEHNECQMAVCEEAGWIVYENDEVIKIARGISDFHLYNSPMAIPKSCIIEIRELRVR